MTPIVIDASVAVKWFVHEEWCDKASLLLPHLSRHHAPEFVELEFANILWKKVRRKEISMDHARSIIPLLPAYVPHRHPQASLLPLAAEIGFSIDHSLYDCIYLACALSQKAPLVTADRRLVNAVANTPFKRHVLYIADLGPLAIH